MNKKTKKILERVVFNLILLCIFFFIVVPIYALSLFYYPQKGVSNFTPKNFGLEYEDVFFYTKDNLRLNGWFIPSVNGSKNAYATIIHVHGNAGKLENHIGFVYWFAQNNYNVFMFDYRDYGLSENGFKTPKNLKIDTISAINYVKKRSDINQDNLVILGQSLGGNNAIAALANSKDKSIKALILDSTFYSYKQIADDKLNGGRFFLSDEFSASENINKIPKIPTLFIHGNKDAVIGHKHSKMLYKKITNEHKKLILISGGNHIDGLQNSVIQKDILNFLDLHVR